MTEPAYDLSTFDAQAVNRRLLVEHVVQDALIPTAAGKERLLSASGLFHELVPGGPLTNCLACENLNRVYESKLTKYLAARSAVLYRISTEFAAKQQVDMERAKNDLEEHLLICPSVMVRRVS